MVLRSIPGSLSSSSSRPGSIICVASAGIVSGSRPGGVFYAASAGFISGIRPGSTLRAAPAGLFLGARPSSHYCAALAGVAHAHLRPDPLGSPGQRLPELRGGRL